MAGPQSLVLSTFLLLLITSTVHSQGKGVGVEGGGKGVGVEGGGKGVRLCS